MRTSCACDRQMMPRTLALILRRPPFETPPAAAPQGKLRPSRRTHARYTASRSASRFDPGPGAGAGALEIGAARLVHEDLGAHLVRRIDARIVADFIVDDIARQS